MKWWEDWVDIPNIKTFSQHASATLAGVGFFSIVHYCLELATLSAISRAILEGLDEFVLVGLFVWLIYQMACILWKGRVKDVFTSIIMAA
jgi:hypothetical protein